MYEPYVPEADWSNFIDLFGIDKEEINEITEQTPLQRYNRAYFLGLSGLSAEDRKSWETTYANNILGMTEELKDNYFRNTVFENIFGNSTDPQDIEIFNNRRNLTKRLRDTYVANKALVSDLDNRSDLRETSATSDWRAFFSDSYRHAIVNSKLGNTLREDAYNYFENRRNERLGKYNLLLYNLDQESINSIFNNINELSNEISPYYKKYNNTSKLPINDFTKRQLISLYLASEEVGGLGYAIRALNEYYQNTVANNLSTLEKVWNSGAQFVDSAMGMLIRTAGMAIGATYLNRLAEDNNGADYWSNVIDNGITRYGDRVATTNSWGYEEQKELQELGLSDNQIINTREQQNSLLTANTPYELFGLYGFTAASTLLSFGASAILKGITSWASTAVRASSLSAKSSNFLLKAIKVTDKIGNLLIPGAVGTVEGGMNAAMTKEQTLRLLNTQIDQYYDLLIQKDVLEWAKQNNITEEQLSELLKNKEFVDLFKAKYLKSIDEDKAAALESAETAMYWDFLGNSIINGFLNSTLKIGQLSPRVQNAMRRFNPFSKTNPNNSFIKTTFNLGAGRWAAEATKVTKGQLVRRRLKEAFGEGLEEYNQDISSAFGLGYANNHFLEYINHKYGDKDGNKAFESDFWKTFCSGVNAGLKAVGKTLLSFDAIKSGLYGGLSTAMGGPNIKTVDTNGNIKFAGITWRGAFGPLFSSKELNSINELREKVAEYFNNFFSKKATLDAFFGASSSALWITDFFKAVELGDEKAARDAKLGLVFNDAVVLSLLVGTTYYDTVVKNLQERANYNSENGLLNDPNSEESKAVDLFLSDLLNKPTNMSREEALLTILKNAQDMLDIIGKIEKESKHIERIFGENIDKDAKESIIFNRLVVLDRKERLKQLNQEMSLVTEQIILQESRAQDSGLSEKSKRIVARVGLTADISKEKNSLKELSLDLSKAISEAKAEISEAKKKGENVELEEVILLFLELERDAIDGRIKDIEEVFQGLSTDSSTEASDNATAKVPILSSLEIMLLSSSDRAFMLNPKNRHLYSAELLLEIDNVNSIGTSLFLDFTKKVADIGRVLRDYDNAAKALSEVVNNPSLLNLYIAKTRLAAKSRMFKNKNQIIADFAERDDYYSFEEALNKLHKKAEDGDNDSQIELASVLEMLKDSKSEKVKLMLLKYNLSKDNKGKILKWAEDNNVIEKNDPRKQLLTSIFDFLSMNNIDISNINEAVDLLLFSPVTSDGLSVPLFLSFVEELNKDLPEDAKISLPESIEEVVLFYKDIMQKYTTSLKEKAVDMQEIDTSKSSDELPLPPLNPVPSNGLLPPTPTNDNSDGAPVSVPTVSDMVRNAESPLLGLTSQDPQDSVSSNEDPNEDIIRKFSENNTWDIEKYARIVLNVIANSPNYSNDIKELARSIILEMTDIIFDDVNDFLRSLEAKAASLDTTSQDGENPVATLLRLASATANLNITRSSSDSEQKKRKEDFFNGDRRGDTLESSSSSELYTYGNPDSSFIQGASLLNILQKHPNGAIALYCRKYNIEGFLQRGPIPKGTHIMFITDSELTEAVKLNMGGNYTSDYLPVIAVILSEDGPITVNINGLDVLVLPISIMPSTGNANVPGSNNMRQIRELANTNKGILVITLLNGLPLTTTLFKPTLAKPNYDPSRKDLPNNKVRDVIHDNMDPNDIGNPEKEKEAKDKFFSRLRKEKKDEKTNKPRKALIYRLDTLDGRTIPIEVFTTPIQDTKNNNGESVLDVADSPQKLTNYNSRTRRATYEFARFLKSFTDKGLIFEDGAPTKETLYTLLQLINKDNSGLRDKITNFIYITASSGWNLFITPTDLFVNGKRLYNLEIEKIETDDLGNDIARTEVLTLFHEGMLKAQRELAAYNFVKNLLVTPLNTIRDGLTWLVNYSESENLSNPMTYKNLSEIYDDNILEVSAEYLSLEYEVLGVILNVPFSSNGSPIYLNPTIANPNNAALSSPLNSPTISSGETARSEDATVDSDSGVLLDGKPKEYKSKALERAIEIEQRIVNDSKLFRISDDELYYIGPDGKKYARVTSIILADVDAKGHRFNPDSPYAVPSTRIGNSVDDFVRDFFSDNPIDYSKYPNATKELWMALAEQLEPVKNYLKTRGLTFITRNTTVTGKIEILDSDGKVKTINVAGTLDLLAYDSNGDFHIIDIKTFRSNIDLDTLEKYSRLVSLYKDFVELQYGISVKSLSILPVNVDYNDPTDPNNKYSESPIRPNLLVLNGKLFTGAHPRFHRSNTPSGLLPVLYRKLLLDSEKLTESERAILQDITNIANNLDGVSDEPILDPLGVLVNNSNPIRYDTVLGTDVDTSAGDDLFDQDFSSGGTIDNIGRSAPIPIHLLYQNLTDLLRENLLELGIDEDIWNMLNDEDMEERLRDCSS